jgi:hypothetical protein
MLIIKKLPCELAEKIIMLDNTYKLIFDKVLLNIIFDWKYIFNIVIQNITT